MAIIKKLPPYIFLVLLFCVNTAVQSADRDDQLNILFGKLKKINKIPIALEIEKKIWNIWLTHPTSEELTQLLAKGSDLMSMGKLELAYEIFSTVIDSDPNWAEGWNKRATVLYLMGRFKNSLNDIDEVLKLEKRHFGALAGQGLVQTKLKNYEKAIISYQAAQKIYPSMSAAKTMIPQLRQIIKDEVI